MDRHLDRIEDDSEIGNLIKTFIMCENISAEMLEILLIRLKRKDCSELKIFYRHDYKGYSNPFNECVALLDSAKLAVMLSFYGDDVNRKFWIKDEHGYEFLHLPESKLINF